MFKNFKLYTIILLLLIFRFFKIFNTIFNVVSKKYLLLNHDEISIIVNMKNLSQKKHLLFYNIMKQLNTTRNFYFIKTVGKTLNENLNKIVENSKVKIVQSNCPDSIFLPLVVSLFGQIPPKLVLFIEGEELKANSKNKLIKWIDAAYKNIIQNKFDYIFGNYQIINGTKIGCSLLFSRSSVIEHLLYYTDSDASHANPFIQLSLATKTKFCFIPCNYAKSSFLENINNKFSSNLNCPSTKDKIVPSFCIMIPAFKRNYFSSSFVAFSNQTYRPKFYIIIQNENKINLNLSLIQKIVKVPIYHIWMQNWNSFFFLNLNKLC